MKKSKTEKLVKKIITDETKSKLYSSAEIAYMKMQLILMKAKRRKKD